MSRREQTAYLNDYFNAFTQWWVEFPIDVIREAREYYRLQLITRPEEYAAAAAYDYAKGAVRWMGGISFPLPSLASAIIAASEAGLPSSATEPATSATVASTGTPSSNRPTTDR